LKSPGTGTNEPACDAAALVNEPVVAVPFQRESAAFHVPYQ